MRRQELDHPTGQARVALIRIDGTDQAVFAHGELTVLEALEKARCADVAIGCRSGGCGVCLVEVLEGRWTVSRPLSREHVSEEDERAGWVLACRIRAASDLRIRCAARTKQEAGRSHTKERPGDR